MAQPDLRFLSASYLSGSLRTSSPGPFGERDDADNEQDGVGAKRRPNLSTHHAREKFVSSALGDLKLHKRAGCRSGMHGLQTSILRGC